MNAAIKAFYAIGFAVMCAGCNSYRLHAGPADGGIDIWGSQFFVSKHIPRVEITVNGKSVTGIMSGYTNATDGAQAGTVLGAAIKAAK